MAEERAAAPSQPVVDRPRRPAAVEAWDLDAPPVDDLDDAEPVAPGRRRTRSELDSILATAVSNAIHRALPADR